MAIKKFPHAVIYNGKLYRANTEIVVEDTEEKKPARSTMKKAVVTDDHRASRKS